MGMTNETDIEVVTNITAGILSLLLLLTLAKSIKNGGGK